MRLQIYARRGNGKLAPKIGYDRAAEIAQESAKTGRRVREIPREKKVIDGKLECADMSAL
jgi:aspartate ammonia-lyase